jgi:hypothetical protein
MTQNHAFHGTLNRRRFACRLRAGKGSRWASVRAWEQVCDQSAFYLPRWSRLLEQTFQRGAAADLPGYKQAQRGTKSRALRISRSALR